MGAHLCSKPCLGRPRLHPSFPSFLALGQPRRAGPRLMTLKTALGAAAQSGRHVMAAKRARGRRTLPHALLPWGAIT